MKFVPFLGCTLMLVLGVLLYGLHQDVVALGQQQPPAPPLPTKDPVTVTDLFDKLGRCHVDLETEQAYQAKLVKRIRELEAQLAKR